MKFIPKSLGREIRTRYNLLNIRISPTRVLRGRKAERRILKTRAQVHSFRIEHPELRVPYNVPRNRKKIKEGVRCLEEAFDWGARNFDPRNFDGPFLNEVCGRVLGMNGPISYRNSNVRLTGKSITPPDYHEVRISEIPNFTYNMKLLLNGGDLIQKIEAAIYAHLHIARIHPFQDGNGRTARTVQDIILDHYSIPSPVVEVGERATYYDLIYKALSDLEEKKSYGKKMNGATEGESLFYTYLAGKINTSLDKMVCDSR